jgi:hypothetical protein
MIVLLDGPSLVVSSITLHVCPPQSMFGFHHVVLSGHEGVLLLIQFSLLRQELLPQLDDDRRLDHYIRRGPEPDNG